MNKIKNIMILLVAFMATSVFAACSDDDPEPNVQGFAIEPQTEFTANAVGDTIYFRVQSTSDVTVTSDQDWARVAQGETSSTLRITPVTVYLSENPTTAERTANISVTAGGHSQNVTITQYASNVIPGDITTTAKEIAANMYPGWNLGNTLEATGGETAWQSTKTTKEIIDFVKAQGFKSVRIPCSWRIHSDDKAQIDAAWMSRVKEIVNYCIDDGLYVVLNDHWDGGWIEVNGFSKSSTSYEPVDEATIAAKADTLKTLWTQIATSFKAYGDHLLFAGLNEPFQQYDPFNGHHAELTPILQRYNQAFVDAVRATGGNNAQRTLVVQTPSTSIASATDATINFTMPTDEIGGAGRLMAEVHYYEPWEFCGQENDGKWFWGTANHVDGSNHNCTWGEENYVQQQMQKLNAKFVQNGYPVIIGEYGANWRQLSANQAEHDASIKLFFQTVTQQAINNGCVPMAWDINATDRNGEKGVMTIIDRANLSVFCTPALDGITAGVAAATWPK